MNSSLTTVVGIPTYNNEDTIGDTLEMILQQTQPPDRVICCDKSNDGTQAVIRSYQNIQSDVSIEIIQQSGDGVADAYNELLDHVSSKYDVFLTLQTNLVVNKNWIEEHLALHTQHPEIDMVTGDNKANDPTNREVNPDERPYYVGRNFSTKCGTLERIGGWDSNFLRGEDWDMRIRLAGAGTRVYAKTELGYEWRVDANDPYVTLSKGKRKPTSVTFLSKYGSWYLGFHPSHVISDGLSLMSVISVVGTGIFIPFAPTLAAVFAIVLTISVITYWSGHVALRGGVDNNVTVGPTRKQLLHGIAVLYASNRVIRGDVEWNMSGFNPDNIPRYKF